MRAAAGRFDFSTQLYSGKEGCMNLQDELKSETRILERLQKERSIRLEKLRQDLNEAKTRGVRGQALQEYRERLQLYDGINQQAINDVKARIEALQEEIDQQAAAAHAQARAELQATREKALGHWLLEGGTKSGFEEAWPSMERDILKERTLAALNPSVSRRVLVDQPGF
jgi:hypothetical protein